MRWREYLHERGLTPTRAHSRVLPEQLVKRMLPGGQGSMGWHGVREGFGWIVWVVDLTVLGVVEVENGGGSPESGGRSGCRAQHVQCIIKGTGNAARPALLT